MSERTVFSLEDRRDRTTAAALLRGIAADLAAGDRLRLGDGEEAASVAVPDSLSVEVDLEVDDEDDETELEVELEWEGSDVRTGEDAADESAPVDGPVAAAAVTTGTGDPDLDAEPDAGAVPESDSEAGADAESDGDGPDTDADASPPAADEDTSDGGEPATSPPEEAVPGPEAAPPASLGRFELYRDRADEWRWRLVHRNGNIVATSGEGYRRSNDARKGIRSVMRNAPGAELVRKE